MSTRAIGIVGCAARWIGRAAVRSTARVKVQAFVKRTLAQKTTTCPPLMEQEPSSGRIVVNRSYAKPQSPPPAHWPTTAVHLPNADRERVEFWVKEARQHEPAPGSLCLSSHPKRNSATQDDLDAILEAIFYREIHTLGLPKTVVASYVERLLNISALINWNILPSIEFFSRKNRESDKSEIYDLSRQRCKPKELVEELSTRENLPFVTIYNTPLTPSNIDVLREFITAKKTELVFYFTYDIKASFLRRANYEAMIAALKTPEFTAADL